MCTWMVHTISRALRVNYLCVRWRTSILGLLGSFFRTAPGVGEPLQKGAKSEGRPGAGPPYRLLGASQGCLLPSAGSVSGSGRSSGERRGDPFQYARLEMPTERGTWRATVRRAAKSRHFAEGPKKGLGTRHLLGFLL